MTLRFVAITTYTALLLTAQYFALSRYYDMTRQEHQVPEVMKSYLSARQLPVNHRIVDADLRPPGSGSAKLPLKSNLVGTYLRVKRQPGEPVTPQMVQTTPQINIEQENSLYVVSLGDQVLATLLDPGMSVILTPVPNEGNLSTGRIRGEVVAVRSDREQSFALVSIKDSDIIRPARQPQTGTTPASNAQSETAIKLAIVSVKPRTP